MARIVGTRVKVIQIVMDRMANGWSPEEIHRQYSSLSLAAIRAAFAYYDAHQDELDAQIERDIERADSLRRQAGVSPLASRLRRSGRAAPTRSPKEPKP